MNELDYVIDPNALEPIILIHGDVGYPEGTMGDKFVKQLMYLDTLGKSRIQVWINSGGGVVMDGEQICNAILKTKTPVDTYNTGTCASVAYPIFACGRKRIMMDWAKNMFHNPFGGDEKALDAFKKTILKIICQRSGGKLTEELMDSIMNRETWIMADESLEMGLCDEVEDSSTYNKAELIKNLDAKRVSRNDFSKILNKVIEDKNFKPLDMTLIKVTNKLSLNTAANEDQIVEAIDKIMNQARVDAAALAQAKKDLEDKEKAYIETKAKFDKMEKDYIETKAKVDAAENKTKEIEAKAYFEKAIKLGKVEVTDETKETVMAGLVKQYVANADGTKAIFDAIPAKNDGADMDELETPNVGSGLNVHDINNKMGENFRKRFKD